MQKGAPLFFVALKVQDEKQVAQLQASKLTVELSDEVE